MNLMMCNFLVLVVELNAVQISLLRRLVTFASTFQLKGLISMRPVTDSCLKICMNRCMNA